MSDEFYTGHKTRQAIISIIGYLYCALDKLSRGLSRGLLLGKFALY